MPSMIQAAALFGVLAASVTAHGHLQAITVDGTSYEAYDPSFQYESSPPEVIEWSCPECLDNGFVDGTMYSEVNLMACHKNATAGAKVATVKAGGTVVVQWTTWPDSHLGPVLDYMAKVDDATSATADELDFFKIDAAGYENDEWASAKLVADNSSWTITIPSDIASGQYVLRHEIIALHSAGTEDGAQNYPKCINLEVTGSGTETPAGETADKFYTPTDPGLLINIYSGDMSDYDDNMPGPALYDGSSSSSSNSTGSDSSSAAGSATTAAPTAAATSSVAAASSAAAAVSSPVAAVSSAAAVATSPAAATPTASSSAASATSSASGSLPTEFTIDTFIAWLEAKTGTSASSKLRRHARAFRN